MLRALREQTTRIAATATLLVALFAGAGSSAAADAPPGPRLATVELIETPASERLENEVPPLMALATVDPASGDQRRFQRGMLAAPNRVVPMPFDGPAWSADGSLLAFNGGNGSRGDRGRIFVVPADGGDPRPLPGTRGGTNPVFSPDGYSLAFSRTRTHIYIDKKHLFEPRKDRSRSYSSTTTWLVDLRGGKPRRLTRWRNGLRNVPGAFTPDGSALLLTKEDSDLDGPRIVRLSLADGASQELRHEAAEPALSADGSRLAFVGYQAGDLVHTEENERYPAGELYVAEADGTGARRLTRTDDVLESSPSWDPSGQRLAYVAVEGDTSFVPGLALLFPMGNALMQVNADGSCRGKVLSQPQVAFYGAAWQPGPGRDAGPIAC